jgi:hypothetical protein
VATNPVLSQPTPASVAATPPAVSTAPPASAPTTKFATFGYIVMAAAFVLPFIGVFFFMFHNGITRPEDFISLTLVCLFIFVTMSTVGLIVLASSGELQMDPSFLKWLAGATIAEVAGMCTIILKSYFH